MESASDPTADARAIIDANLYMVLATADEEGRPWASPVYYAPQGYRELFWVSRPERGIRGICRHDRSSASSSSIPRCRSAPAEEVYISAVAEHVTGDEETGIDVFSRRSLAHGGNEWTPAHVREPATLRLYRATAEEIDVLGEGDQRVQVSL